MSSFSAGFLSIGSMCLLRRIWCRVLNLTGQDSQSCLLQVQMHTELCSPALLAVVDAACVLALLGSAGHR